jgi:WD40 repeat protein
MQSWRELATLKVHTAGINNLAFSLDARMLATGSSDNTIKVWYVERAVKTR